MTNLVEDLAGLPTPLVLLVAGVLASSGTGIGSGVVLPGETGYLTGGATVRACRSTGTLVSEVAWR
ncbi:hypothetical protein ABKW28_14565 [Nocardioides sp. 31GB23]|uniref:hypothetical protein n=1 Tax=Nocardioides sp. 31GB23 TaxID=3156065 RepID=UPI0032AF67A0